MYDSDKVQWLVESLETFCLYNEEVNHISLLLLQESTCDSTVSTLDTLRSYFWCNLHLGM